MGRRMLEHALADEVPFGWVAADAVYGMDPKLRAFCHHNRLRQVLAVPVCLPLSGPPGGNERQPKVARSGWKRTRLGRRKHGWLIPGPLLKSSVYAFRHLLTAACLNARHTLDVIAECDL
ncbi:hypothetical protein ABT272_45385 [Streptomyces sp900105245]|uniref:Transposase n=1 Tax=Streptomyces sp. 900105245 TaxID=3154379 RepID=A0ABV1ULS0_9ACTN